MAPRIILLVKGKRPEEILQANGLPAAPLTTSPTARTDSGLGSSPLSNNETSPKTGEPVAATTTTTTTTTLSTPTKVCHTRKLTKAEKEKAGISKELEAKYSWIGITAKNYTFQDIGKRGSGVNLDHGPSHKSVASYRLDLPKHSIQKLGMGWWNKDPIDINALSGTRKRKLEVGDEGGNTASSRPKRQRKGIGNGTRAEQKQAKKQREQEEKDERWQAMKATLRSQRREDEDYASSVRYHEPHP